MRGSANSQLSRNEIITISQTTTLPQNALGKFSHLLNTDSSEKKTTTFISIADPIATTEKSGSFVNVELTKKSLAMISEQISTQTVIPDLDDCDFDDITDEAIPTVLTDSEITFLAMQLAITLPGLNNTPFISATFLISNPKERLLALPEPLLQNDPASLSDNDKKIIALLNKWHAIHRSNDLMHLALAETAYFYDGNYHRLVIRHAPIDATTFEKTNIANQHIDVVTEEIVKRLNLPKENLQIHQCIPWIQPGLFSDHIILKIKTDTATINGDVTTEEHFFDPAMNRSAFMGRQSQHSMNVQAMWNRSDCGRYVTLAATIAALILSKRAENKSTLHDDDLEPYLTFIKSAENCTNTKALQAELLTLEQRVFLVIPNTESSPLSAEPPKSSSTPDLEALAAYAYGKVSFLFQGARSTIKQSAEKAASTAEELKDFRTS